MNTTKKGNDLEERVFKYVQSLIKNGSLGLFERNCRVFKQKAYPSLERGPIIFDVSIEVYFYDQITPSFIILIECKNYKSTVPVDDIQVFSDNVSNVALNGAKAICVTTKGFQRGSLKIAKARKIALWKITDQGHETILNRRFNATNDKFSEIKKCLLDTDYIPNGYGLNFIQSPYRLTTCFKDLISDFLLEDINLATEYSKKITHQQVKYISKNSLSKIGESVFKKHFQNQKINLEEIAQNHNLKIVRTSKLLNNNIVAEVNFKKNIIILYGDKVFSEKQLNFSLAHELAHKILNHDRFFTSENQLSDQQSSGHTNILVNKDIERLEFQANYLAACILLPELILKETFFRLLKHYDIKDRGFKPLFIDSQPCNKYNFMKVCLPLAEYFQVSQTVLKIRLIDLELATFEDELPKFKWEKQINSFLE